MAGMSRELIRALESECGYGSEEVLKEKKKEDFEALQSFLSTDPSVKPAYRQNAIYLLGRWDDPAPAKKIHDLLPKLSEHERLNAIDALGRLGTPEALSGILEYSSDSSPDVRRFVLHALKRIKAPAARAKLKEMASKDPVDYVRTRASEYLDGE